MRPNVVGGTLPHEAGRSLSQHAVEFVDKQIDRFVGIAGCHRRRQIRSGDFDAALCCDDPHSAVKIRFNVDPHPEDVGMVTEKPFGFPSEGRFHCVGQPNVDPAQDEFGTGCGGYDWCHGIVYRRAFTLLRHAQGAPKRKNRGYGLLAIGAERPGR